MKKLSRFWLVMVAAAMIFATLGCASFGGGSPEPQAKPTRPADKPAKPTKPVQGPKGKPTDAPVQKPTDAPAQPGEQATQPSAPSTGNYDTKFPLPENVQNFMKLDAAAEAINFQTSMSLDEVVEFYRQAFQAQGLKERTLLTVIEPGKTFSLVFDGSPNGKALVIQGVALSSTQTNVNIRYEDV